MTKRPAELTSPKWNWTTRLVVGITLVAVVAFLAVRFQNLIGPLLLAFILAYLFYPLARFLTGSVKDPVAPVSHADLPAVHFDCPGFINLGRIRTGRPVTEPVRLPATNFCESTGDSWRSVGKRNYIGFIHINLSNLDYSSVSQEILSIVEPYMGKVGNFVGVVAGGAASVIGWLFFILLVSYFMLAETGGIQGRLLHFAIPNYEQDMRRLGRELSRIWNAFLRGQSIVVIITVLMYMVIFGDIGFAFPDLAGAIGGFCQIPAVGRPLYCLDDLWTGGIFSGADTVRIGTIYLRDHRGGYCVGGG